MLNTEWTQNLRHSNISVGDGRAKTCGTGSWKEKELLELMSYSVERTLGKRPLQLESFDTTTAGIQAWESEARHRTIINNLAGARRGN